MNSFDVLNRWTSYEQREQGSEKYRVEWLVEFNMNFIYKKAICWSVKENAAAINIQIIREKISFGF